MIVYIHLRLIQKLQGVVLPLFSLNLKRVPTPKLIPSPKSHTQKTQKKQTNTVGVKHPCEPPVFDVPMRATRTVLLVLRAEATKGEDQASRLSGHLKVGNRSNMGFGFSFKPPKKAKRGTLTKRRPRRVAGRTGLHLFELLLAFYACFQSTRSCRFFKVC